LANQFIELDIIQNLLKDLSNEQILFIEPLLMNLRRENMSQEDQKVFIEHAVRESKLNSCLCEKQAGQDKLKDFLLFHNFVLTVYIPDVSDVVLVENLELLIGPKLTKVFHYIFYLLSTSFHLRFKGFVCGNSKLSIHPLVEIACHTNLIDVIHAWKI